MISDYIHFVLSTSQLLVGGFASKSINQLASKNLTQNQKQGKITAKQTTIFGQKFRLRTLNKETSQPIKQTNLVKSFDSKPKKKAKQLASKPKTEIHHNRVVCVKRKTRREVTAKQQNRN